MRRQSVRSLALLQAEWWIPVLTDCTSELIPLSHVERGRLQGLLQWLGGWSDASLTRWWSCWKSARATCPKKRSRLSWIRWETGQQPVICLTVALVTCLVYEIRRILRNDHESKASSRRARVIVTDQTFEQGKGKMSEGELSRGNFPFPQFIYTSPCTMIFSVDHQTHQHQQVVGSNSTRGTVERSDLIIRQRASGATYVSYIYIFIHQYTWSQK